MNQCFKIKVDTDYAKEVKEHFEMRAKWSSVFKGINELLGEGIKEMVLDPETLCIDPSDLKNDENKKLFSKSGKLKTNTKRSKEVAEKYKSIIADLGLSKFQSMSYINFAYGVMRFQGETLESYNDGDGMIYFKASFDLSERSHGNVEPITEIEYQERYLELLKKSKVA